MALLVNPTNRQTAPLTKGVEAAARAVGQQLHIVEAGSEREIDAAFASLGKLGVRALVIANDGLFINRPEQLGALALRHAVPAIFQTRELPRPAV